MLCSIWVTLPCFCMFPELTVIDVQVKPEDAARIRALEKEMQAAQAELAKLQQNAAGLLQQAEQLQGRVDNAGGAKMQQQKQAVADLQQVGLLYSSACSSTHASGMACCATQPEMSPMSLSQR